ncbi:MAG: AIR synthase-related protein, partial [Sediminibacterium sp.]
DEVVYIGKNKMTDTLQINGETMNVGKLLLSPTRTYAPLLKQIMEQQFDAIDGVIHCSGGGQTKCMKYLPNPLTIIKDHLFEPPPVFELIRTNSGADWKEMYQVFNMGHRLEIFTTAAAAEQMIRTAATFNIEAQVVGRVEAADNGQSTLLLKGDFGTLEYKY